MAKRGEASVLSLCTGNSYRSRFAEAVFNAVAARMACGKSDTPLQ